MLTPFKVIVVAGAVSCALMGSGRASELFEHAKAQMTEAMKVCDAKFPAGVQSVVMDRTRCQIEAIKLMRIVTPVPELLDKFLQIRLYVGEQIAAGQMTFARGNKIIAEEKARVIAEEKRILQQRQRAVQPARPIQPAPAYQPPVQQSPVIVQRPVVVDPGPVTCIHITPMVTTCD
jgi:hypothetical protein